MTLNEKLEEAIKSWIPSDRCEEIADQHAIDFTKWIINVSTSNTLKYLTIEELLEIYKKL
jgi:hypothetical protein